MQSWNSTPTVSDSEFSFNWAEEEGGGAFSGNAHFKNVVFYANSSGSFAPVSGGSSFENVLFLENSTESFGAGALETCADLTNVVFDGNRSWHGAGALDVGCSSPELRNVVFVGNEGHVEDQCPVHWCPPEAVGGGAMYASSGNALLVNVTFAGNACTGSNSVGGLYLQTNSATLINTVFWGNTRADDLTGANPQPSQIHVESGSSYITHSLIEGSGGSGSGWDSSLGVDGGNNLDTDPRFVDEENHNLRLRPWSPAVDAGTSALVPLPATDPDGNPRIMGSETDMGAYEWDGVTAVENELPIPSRSMAYAPYPNPFNPSTTIRFDLAEASPVLLRIYNPAGRLVRTIQDGRMTPAGVYRVPWNGEDNQGAAVASGVYLYRLEAGSLIATKSMVLVR